MRNSSKILFLARPCGRVFFNIENAMSEKSCFFCTKIIGCNIRNDFASVQDDHQNELRSSKTFRLYNYLAEFCKKYEWDGFKI